MMGKGTFDIKIKFDNAPIYKAKKKSKKDIEKILEDLNNKFK